MAPILGVRTGPILFTFLLLLLNALIISPADAYSISNPIKSQRNIRSELWHFFRRQVHIYNGLIVRIGSDGGLINFSFTKRNLTEIPNQPKGKEKVLLTLDFKNPSFPRSGVARQQYLYYNQKPVPEFGVLLYPNGTLSSQRRQGFIAFYPYRYGVWAANSVTDDAPLFAVEKFLLHPVRNHRVNIIPVYLSGKFSQVTLSRDEQFSRPYGQAKYSSFTAKKTGTVITSDLQRTPVLFGLWSSVRYCLLPDYTLKRTIKTEFQPKVGLPIGEKFTTLALPDGIEYAGPKNVGPSLLGKTTAFYLQWNIDYRTVIRSITYYNRKGEIASECTTGYYKLF